MTELEEQFFEVIHDVVPLEDDQKNFDTTIDSLALDSLDLVEMAQKVEEEFNFLVEDDTVLEWKTLGDIFAYVKDNHS